MNTLAISFFTLFVSLIALPFFAWKFPRQARVWADFADGLGLKFETSTQTVHGVYRGRVMRLDKNRKFNIIVGMILNILGAVFGGGTGVSIHNTRIQRKLELASPSTLFLDLRRRNSLLSRHTGIVTGDKQFDAQFSIESSPANFASAIFREPALRERICELHGSMKVVNDVLEYEEPGLLKSLERLTILFELLADVSDIIEKFDSER